MLRSFFALAAQSPSRQQAFRQMVFTHLLLVFGGAAALHAASRVSIDPTAGVLTPPARLAGAPILGHILLITGIVEGAMLIGWRLTQLPKSQALEFLLVSPLNPRGLFLAEALVGIVRLAWVTLAGLPGLVLLFADGYLDRVDIVPLLVMPFTWGCITGFGLTAWAYEPRSVRRWFERVLLVGIGLYLGVGVIVGENLRMVTDRLKGIELAEFTVGEVTVPPLNLGRMFFSSFEAFHLYNPFAVIEYWLAPFSMMKPNMQMAFNRMAGLEIAAATAVIFLLARAAFRLKGHFHERHYRPVADESGRNRGIVGDWPLSWWAVRRVTEYSGRVNLWLAGSFGCLFAFYIVADSPLVHQIAGGSLWPHWLGRRVFEIFEEKMGGVPGLATALVVLAAVPAAFQYGLWDSNTQDRCRRLELLLLTELGPRDYWSAAAAAAWKRGRGYFWVALILWMAGAVAGKITLAQMAVAMAAGVVLWGLYFTLGFRAFSRGILANRLGLLLTLGLPLLAFTLYKANWHFLADLVPPGSVYAPVGGSPPVYWLAGPLIGGAIMLVLSRFALARCDAELRLWYDQHHGVKVID
jgi:hypothetical protein